ncbi:MAG TPA: hypothetical protein VHV30_15275 [Polyangiaceae bacterium]|nr:hypothetical protein [Polyangiaceae bacterium]
MSLGALAGCTSALANGGVPGDAEATTTSAVVIVERSVDETAGTRAETSARFVRVPASASLIDALRTIGAAVDLPAPSSCASVAALANTGAAVARVAAAEVELADVGAVSLEASGHETRLLPRQIPDVTDVVSGVVYARAGEPALFPASTRYVVHVAGGADVDPFDVTATAPADPSDVKVAGDDGTTGVTVATGSPIELSWAADGSDDALYVDVQPAGFRCALADGAGAADAQLHASIPAALLDEAGSLVVHRVHREALAARGIETGEVRFDFSRSLPYVRH